MSKPHLYKSRDQWWCVGRYFDPVAGTDFVLRNSGDSPSNAYANWIRSAYWN